MYMYTVTIMFIGEILESSVQEVSMGVGGGLPPPAQSEKLKGLKMSKIGFYTALFSDKGVVLRQR